MAFEKMDARGMRLHNAVRVLRAVKQWGPLSRVELARRTMLSAPTVAALVGELIKADLAGGCGAGMSSGGRKPQLVSFNAQAGLVLGGNINTTAVRLVLADLAGEILVKRTVSNTGETRPLPTLRAVAAAAREMIREVRRGGRDSQLLAAVIGAPGMTDLARGVVLEAANLDGWVDVPARDLLRKELRVPVIIDNDVNLAALGEHWRGGGRGLRNFVFVSMGTGIGAGIIIDGKLHRGNQWYAGEISHLNVDFREWSNDFGAAGYLESYLGATPRTKARRAVRRGVVKNGGAMNVNALDDEAVLRLGAAVANIATILDPELIVFGGRLVKASPDVTDRVHRVAASIAPNCSQIVRTELGEDAALFGSVRLGLDLAEESIEQLLGEKIFALTGEETALEAAHA